jgi:hypothetical protein
MLFFIKLANYIETSSKLGASRLGLDNFALNRRILATGRTLHLSAGRFAERLILFVLSTLSDQNNGKNVHGSNRKKIITLESQIVFSDANLPRPWSARNYPEIHFLCKINLKRVMYPGIA